MHTHPTFTKQLEIPADIRTEIVRRLASIEANEGVRILFAIESGSRAWGFPSPDSDYDVRFVYMHRPDWYLSIDLEEKRDVIERPIVDDIDLNGWDIRKALRLFKKTNPTLVEWIQSPIRYVESGHFADHLGLLLRECYAGERGIFHYRSTAQTTYAKYLRSSQIRLKKYFYALRPLLAARWIETYQTAPPIEFSRLLSLVAGNSVLCRDINDLLNAKRMSSEMACSAPIPSIQVFIESELVRLKSFRPKLAHHPLDIAKLNTVFQAALEEFDHTVPLPSSSTKL